MNPNINHTNPINNISFNHNQQTYGYPQNSRILNQSYLTSQIPTNYQPTVLTSLSPNVSQLQTQGITNGNQYFVEQQVLPMQSRLTHNIQ
jgi:hypothetical protein